MVGMMLSIPFVFHTFSFRLFTYFFHPSFHTTRHTAITMLFACRNTSRVFEYEALISYWILEVTIRIGPCMYLSNFSYSSMASIRTDCPSDWRDPTLCSTLLLICSSAVTMVVLSPFVRIASLMD